jgi:hypothetical protein
MTVGVVGDSGFAAPPAPPLFCGRILQRCEIQHRLRQQLIAAGNLVLEGLQPPPPWETSRPPYLACQV